MSEVCGVYRVSNVDAYRKWRDNQEAEEEDLQRLVADIRGESEPSQAMRAGTAFHAILEGAADGDVLDTVSRDGFKFNLRAEISYPLPQIRELRSRRTWVVDGEPITISGQCDAISGGRIEDIKTTSRFDPDRYLEGYQWRLYLSIFGLDWFRWRIFEMRETEEGSCQYDVFAHHVLDQHGYPAMHDDCARLVVDFARFVRQHVER